MSDNRFGYFVNCQSFVVYATHINYVYNNILVFHNIDLCTSVITRYEL